MNSKTSIHGIEMKSLYTKEHPPQERIEAQRKFNADPANTGKRFRPEEDKRFIKKDGVWYSYSAKQLDRVLEIS